MIASERPLSLLAFLLVPALAGLALSVLLAERQYTQQQARWVTQWLVPELERVVPPYWVTAEGVDNLAHIDTVYQQGRAYWAPFPAVANSRIAAIRGASDQTRAAAESGYILHFPQSRARLDMDHIGFFARPDTWLRLAGTTAAVLLAVALAVRLLPRPYSAGQRAALAAGLNRETLAHTGVARLFDREQQLPLMVRLLASGEADIELAVNVCRHDAAAQLATRCLDDQWPLEDVMTLLRDGMAQSRFPDPRGADPVWWRLLTQQHQYRPLEALAYSQQPDQLVLNPETASISVRGLTGSLSPKYFTFLAYLAARINHGEGPLPLPGKSGDIGLTEALATIYEDLPRSRDQNVFKDAMTGEDLNQIRSHLNRSIRSLIGNEALSCHYEVKSIGRKKQQVSYTLECDVLVR